MWALATRRWCTSSRAFRVGGAITFSFTLALRPSKHRVAVSMGDGEAVVEVDVRTAELVVEALGSRVTGDGFIALEARVTNEGELPADSVVVTASWVSADGERSGAMERAGTLERLGANESDVFSLPIAIPTGAYILELGVESETLESVRDDNFAETRVEVDYVQLSLEIASVKLLGYETGRRWHCGGRT